MKIYYLNMKSETKKIAYFQSCSSFSVFLNQFLFKWFAIKTVVKWLVNIKTHVCYKFNNWSILKHILLLVQWFVNIKTHCHWFMQTNETLHDFFLANCHISRLLHFFLIQYIFKALILKIYSGTCLNQTCLGPTFVFGIDRCLLYTG